MSLAPKVPAEAFDLLLSSAIFWIVASTVLKWRVRSNQTIVPCATITETNVDYDDYLAAFSQTRIPVTWPAAIPNLQPRDDIWPTDRAQVIRRLEDSTNEFTELRGGFPPARPKRLPVIKSEITQEPHDV
jgi:putative SOS response-associated peptidase YedK